MTTFRQDTLHIPVNDSYKDQIAVIAAQVEIASHTGAMAPISLTDMAGFANKDMLIKSLYSTLRAVGFSGKFLLFTRQLYERSKGKQHTSQTPIGLPINLAEFADTFYALYLPPTISRLSIEETQKKLDETALNFTGTQNGSLPFKGKILAVSPQMLATWQTESMWPLHAEVLDPQNAQFSLGNTKESQEIFESGNEFMQREYIPSLLAAIEIMAAHNLVPAQLTESSGNLNGIFLENGFFHIYFSALTNTGHTNAQRTWVARRDIHCHFPISGHFDGQNSRFSVPELISLYKLQSIRRETDPKQAMMGVDSSAFLEDETQALESSDHFCATHLMGRYTEIKHGTKSLSAQSGSFELHHIVPRGVAYISLLTGILKGDLTGTETPQEMMFYLRAARVRDLVFSESKQYFVDRLKVYQTLSQYLNNIDHAVNSPYNMVCLCKNCHHLIHPDMRYARRIATFIETVNRKLLVFDPSKKTEYISQILGEKTLSKMQLSQSQVMRNLHQARRLVGLLGKPYHLCRVMGYDATDDLLDFARLQTEAELTKQKDFVVGVILDNFEKSDDPNQRHQAWRMTQLLENHSTLEILRMSKLPLERIDHQLLYGDVGLLQETAKFIRNCGIQSFYVQRQNEEKLEQFEQLVGV